MFDKTKTKISEAVAEKTREGTGPIVTVLYMILAVLGGILLALVTHAN